MLRRWKRWDDRRSANNFIKRRLERKVSFTEDKERREIMSKLSEYSKFDHLDDSSSSEDEIDRSKQNQRQNVPNPVINPQRISTTPNGNTQPGPISLTKKGSEDGRYIFEHNVSSLLLTLYVD